MPFPSNNFWWDTFSIPVFLFLCSIFDEKGNNCLVKYKYEEQNLKKIFEKEKAHDNYIYSCVELNERTIASGGYGNGYSIKLWKD